MSWNVPHLMSADDVAEHLGVTAQTVHRMRRRGEFKGVHIGKTVMYDPTDIREFITNNKEGEANADADTRDTSREADTEILRVCS